MKSYRHLIIFLVCMFLFAGCQQNPLDPADDASGTEGVHDIQSEEGKHSPYIRQNWALNLQTSEVDRIELVTKDESAPSAVFTGDDMIPYVEMLNSIDGEFVAEPIVQGCDSEIYRSTLYVFMRDRTYYTITKVAGVDQNYVIIDDSAFVCNDTLFEKFPESGSGSHHKGHAISGTPAEEPPADQISKPVNIAPEQDPLPVPVGFETYDWMANLRAEDVDYIEFVYLDDPQLPYHRYEGEEIQEIVDLFHNNLCYKYTSSEEWDGYFNKEFHVMMKDGTAHKVASIHYITTVIDGAAYETFSQWLFEWPEVGDTALPEDWFQTVAERNYHTVPQESSTFSTHSYDAQLDTLNQEYDTDLKMGAVSRNYTIGRGVVSLTTLAASPEVISLDAHWTGALGIDQIQVKPQYWLERWQGDVTDGAVGYAPIAEDQWIQDSEQELIAKNHCQWNIDWSDTYGSLEPGHYRIGMTLCEEQNGTEVNSTTCYAKFAIE